MHGEDKTNSMDMPGKESFEERETELTEATIRYLALEEQPTQPIVTKARVVPRLLLAFPRQRRWFLSGFSALLIGCIVLGVFLSWIALGQWFSSPTTSGLPQALHPEINVIHSSGVNTTVSLFMQNMLRKNWPALWSSLAPDAQSLWRGKQDFTHFEQAKFGALTLQSYTTSQTVVNKPWLDPDTTRIYDSVTTLQVSLQATAPSGLLTDPSKQALDQGLFQHTLFALVQNGQQAWKVLIAGPADLDAPVLTPAKPPVSHLIIPIFMYHHISSQPTHNALDYSLTVITSDFEAQLTWMQKQGYQAITMTELFDAFYYGKALPSRPMILTFDDGYADIYTYALPVLLAHHYRGVFYIITGSIGGDYVTWDEVRTLARSGMQIESHTVHHVNIGEPPPGTTTQKELMDSKTKLQAELGMPIQFFCYPTGEPFHHDTLAEQQIVLQDLFADGYLSATLDPFSIDSALQNSQMPYQLPRIRVGGGETLTEYMDILASTLAADQQRLQQLDR